MKTDAKIIKSTDLLLVEFREYLINEIAITHKLVGVSYPPIGNDANYWLGKYRALNETLIELDHIMKG
jgi:hypothetical protein